MILNGRKIKSKVPLRGAELEEFLQKERAAKEREAAQQAALARTQLLLEADDDSDSDDTDSDSDQDDMDEAPDGGNEATLHAIEPGGGGLKRSTSRQGGGMRSRSGRTDPWSFDGDEGSKQFAFDIYLKGNTARSTSFFKIAAGQTQRFRMFPYIERRRRVDGYGEVVDVALWVRKGKILEENAQNDQSKEKSQTDAEVEAKARVADPFLLLKTDPTAEIISRATLKVRGVHY